LSFQTEWIAKNLFKISTQSSPCFCLKKKKIFPFHIKAKKDAGIISYFFFKFQISKFQNFKIQISI